MKALAKPFTRFAHAKLNLCLEVGLPARGLHTVVSAIAELSVADVVRFEPSPEGFGVVCDLPGLDEESNIAWRAAAALELLLPDVRVVIEKKIPPQSGLGGGSSDAATVLAGLATILLENGVSVSRERVATAALLAGSDVPSFFVSGLRIVSGVGDVVQSRACQAPAWSIVLLRPPVGSSTAHAYELLDRNGVPHELGAGAMAAADTLCEAFCRADFDRFLSLLHNDFTHTIESAMPAVAGARRRLTDAGARATILCGSGSCVAGFFEEEAQAHKAAERIVLGEGEWMSVTTFARG